MFNKYIKRICDKKIKEILEISGAIWIQGPKWCGKSTTAKTFSKFNIELQNNQTLELIKLQISNNSNYFLEKATPILIDEWQEMPEIWDLIRLEVDKRNKNGQFILTGSKTPDTTKIHHSGIGRINKLKMSTLSLFESNESSGKISLSKILNNEQDNYFFTSEKNMNDIAFFLCRGGWPNIISQQLENSKALKLANLYYSNLISYNLDNFFDKEKDLKLIEAIIKVYARNVSSMVSNNTIKKDIESISNIKVSEEKIRQLVNKLIDLFIIDEVEPWSPNLRSKAIIRNSNVKYFSDPSIAASALSTNPNDLFNDLNTFGLLFENLVIRDLKIYAESLDGKILHYRDNNGLEVDAILKLPNGKWGLIEIKLGSNDSIEKAANNLKKLASLISDKEKYSKPSFMMIITAGNQSYIRQDKIIVCPITCLKD